MGIVVEFIDDCTADHHGVSQLRSIARLLRRSDTETQCDRVIGSFLNTLDQCLCTFGDTVLTELRGESGK